jgi:type II secretory pathway pseudopilin PulG
MRGQPTLRRSRPSRGSRGFTILEVILYLIIASIVVAGVYKVLVGQNRLYVQQRELMDVRGGLRAAAAVLSWELRHASTDGDLYNIWRDSLTMRSVQGQGVVCSKHGTAPRLGLWGLWGEFGQTTTDSSLVFAARSSGLGDDSWIAASNKKLWGATGGGVPWCFWGDSTTTPTEEVLELAGVPTDSVLLNIKVGAPLRTFRQIRYGIYQEDGRWWLGRKIGGAGSYQRLTGPLLSPSDSGLVFSYFDDTGASTNDPSRVAIVEITLRGESVRSVTGTGVAPRAMRDGLTTRVFLRGDVSGVLSD